MQHGPAMHMGPMSKKLAFYEVALKRKKQLADGTHAFVFEKPKGFKFTAGQHVRITLIDPSETDVEGDKRFFTIASTPEESDLVFAMRMRDTAFKRVVSRMKPGEKVLIEKLLGESPHGSFVLHEDATKPAVFLAGGIGIVPAYAMIKDALERSLSYKIFLFYANRRPEDAPFLDELKELARKHSSFELIATMTEPKKSAESWRGETGRIDGTMLKKHIDNLTSPIYYIAGLPEMTSAMQAVLTNLGVNKEHIRAEEFTGFNLNEIHDAPKRTWKSYFPFMAIAAVILTLITLHTGVAASLSHASFSVLSFTNPVSYLLIGVLLIAIAIKVFVVFKLKHLLGFKQDKITMKHILKAHMPSSKER